MKLTFLKLLFKIVVFIFLFIFVLYLAVLALFPKYFNKDLFKTNLENEIQKQTGLITNIEDVSIKMSLYPHLNVNAYHVAFLYPDNRELLKIKDLNIKIKVLPVVFRNIKIDKITVNRPILNITVDEKGNSSIDKYLKPLNTNGNFSGFKYELSVPEVDFLRYKIKIYTKNDKIPFIAEGNQLKAEPSKIAPNRIKTTINGTLSYNEKPYINYNTHLDTVLPELKNKLFETNYFEYIKKHQIKCDISSKFTINLDKNNKSDVNGDVTIDNLKFIVDNQSLDNNFIKLKINNNQIYTDANLKTSAENKIQITGFVNPDKNLNIDLKCVANNVELGTFSETVSTILKIFNVKNMLSSYKITGKANFDFAIKGNKNHIQSQGIAQIINGTITGENLSKISNINSKINLNNNTIKIESSDFKINENKFALNGNINKNTEMDLHLNGQNIVISQLFQILPTEYNKNNSYNGFMDINANIKGNFKEPFIAVLSKLKNFTLKNNEKIIVKCDEGQIDFNGKINDNNIIINSKNLKLLPFLFNNLTAETIKINTNKNIISSPDLKLILNNNPITANLQISDFQSENPSYNFDFQGKIKSSDLTDIIRKQNSYKNIKITSKGEILSQGKISGTKDSAEIKLSFDADKDNYLSLVNLQNILNCNTKLNINAVIKNNQINIDNFSLNKLVKNDTYEKILYAKGKITDFDNLVFKDFGINIPKPVTVSLLNPKNSEITLTSALVINGKISEPKIQGVTEIQNLQIPEYQVRSTNGNIVFEKDKIKLSAPNIRIGNSIINVTSNVVPIFNQKICLNDFVLNGNAVNLSEINEIFKDLPTGLVYPGIKTPVDISSGKANIKHLKENGLEAQDISCDISLIKDVLSIKNIKGTAYNGSITGESEYNFLQTSSKIELYGKNANMRNLLKALTGKDDETVGILDYKLKLNTIGNQRNQQLKTARGYITFTATKGVLGPLGQFEHFLYAQNLISEGILKTKILNVVKAIKPKNTGIYTKAKGKIEILNGNAILKPVLTEGPNMSLYVLGKISLLSDFADIQIYGRISQEIEKCLGDIVNPFPKTIMSKSSETSIGNLFYDEYNTSVPKSILDAIPPLNPNSGQYSRAFVVKILGTPEDVKSIKYFKWIVSVVNAPTVNIINKDNQTNNEVTLQQNIQEQENNNQENNNGQNTGKNTNLPSFINNLPDNVE